MRRYINKHWYALALLTLSWSAFSQSVIKGIVKDDLNEPLPGVNVFLEGTQKGAVTDFDGNYEINNIGNGDYTLVATYVGFKDFRKKITLSGGILTENITMAEDALSLETVIVTGVVNARSRIESSVSVTSLDPVKVGESAPRSTAEIFRTIPGIRSESSGGEGNSNIAVRGVPISSGGSKYVQLQEDGLPLLLYGDISFATADMYTRFDSNVARIEAIRGGSASVLSSNSPGGIINIIDKTGRQEGGSISSQFGVDYENFRTDIEYGSPINDKWTFHVGGFYRYGEGIRTTENSKSNNGGQFKGNITRNFDNGYIRLYLKALNDRTVSYMPMPLEVTGTNSNPQWRNAPGFDATHGALQTPYLTNNTALDYNGNLRNAKVSDGMHVNSQSVGLELSFDLGNDWKIRNNGRYAFNSGRFLAPFPASVGTAADLKTELDQNYATNVGFAYANDGSAVPNDALVMQLVMFDAELNNLNNLMNDFRLSKSFGTVETTLGFFKANQNLDISWQPNTYLQEVSGKNARLINAFDATNNPLTYNGLSAYGVPTWGGINRRYNTKYDVYAPYLNLSVNATENLNFEGGVRYDYGKVTGSFAGQTTVPYDMNGDGVISTVESNVAVVDRNNYTKVDYDYSYLSYTLGANYKFTDRQSVFARYSRGASAKADRILLNPALNYQDGKQLNARDFIDQAELGYKQLLPNGAVYATAFYAKTTEEGGYEATSNSIIENDYRSMGVELEAFYRFGAFDVRGAVTYTDAEITSGTNEGNKPRRQPDFIYNVMPSFAFGKEKVHSVGVSVIGQTKAYSQDSNELIMPGFALVNGYVNIRLIGNLNLNAAVNNIFDSIGITEAEEASIISNATNFVRARTLPGRSVSATLSYKF
ncbi:MAG: TonB-dependent receptor [Capnocytophaga sp.]|nr:TonB-dependent receptor [Capnocytophaga sp.]